MHARIDFFFFSDAQLDALGQLATLRQGQLEMMCCRALDVRLATTGGIAVGS